MALSLRDRTLFTFSTNTLQERRAFNEITKINTLPNGILLDIFLLNTHFNPKNPHLPSKALRSSSQVCAKWRRFLRDDCPTVWAASLDFSDPMPVLREMLSLTASEPVDVVFPSPFFKSLDINTYASWPVPFSIFEHQAANLHKMDVDNAKLALALSLFPRSRTFIISFVSDPRTELSSMVEAIDNLKRQSAPHLHTFSLDIPAPVWTLLRESPLKTSSFPSQIRHLALCANTLNLNANGASVASSWLQILGTMTNLESLELDYSLYSGTEEDTSNVFPAVNLPRLKYFRLRGNHSTCKIILQKLELLPTCGFKIQIEDERTDDVFYSVMSEISRRVALMDAVQVLVFFCAPDRLMISNGGRISTKNNLLSLHWFTKDDDHYREIFAALCQMMRSTCTRVKTLQLSVEHHHAAFRNEHFVRLLQLFPNIEELCLLKFTTFLRLHPLVTYAGPESNRPILRKLQKLSLCYFCTDNRQRKYQLCTYKAEEDFICDFLAWKPQINMIRLVNCDKDYPKELFSVEAVEEHYPIAGRYLYNSWDSQLHGRRKLVKWCKDIMLVKYLRDRSNTLVEY